MCRRRPGSSELAARVERHTFSTVTDLPVLMVPGVRSGPLTCERDLVGSTDVIRGEEIIALGLHLLDWLPAGGIVLSLGSHWKAIHVDRDGRITSSVTSLGGELIDVVTSQTVSRDRCRANGRQRSIRNGSTPASTNRSARASGARCSACGCCSSA